MKDGKITISRVPVDPNEKYNCSISLTMVCEPLIMPIMHELFEIELLQGEKVFEENGNTRYSFNCYDDYKIDILSKALHEAFRKSGGNIDITTNQN